MATIFTANGVKPAIAGGKNVMSKPRPFTIWEMGEEFEVKNERGGNTQGKQGDSLVFDDATGELTSMTPEEVAAHFEEVV